MFEKLTADVTDDDAVKVADGCVNSFAWIVGHLIGSRNFVAQMAGSQIEFTHPEYRGGIITNESTVIRARLYSNGAEPGDV